MDEGVEWMNCITNQTHTYNFHPLPPGEKNTIIIIVIIMNICYYHI